MKLLLDACVWGGATAVLEGHGHDVIWAGSWDQDPGDQQILARSYSERRIVVTLDKDFGELAIVRRQPHVGIIRLVGFPARQQGIACAEVLQRYAEEFESPLIVTVEPHRVRVRPTEAD